MSEKQKLEREAGMKVSLNDMLSEFNEAADAKGYERLTSEDDGFFGVIALGRAETSGSDIGLSIYGSPRTLSIGMAAMVKSLLDDLAKDHGSDMANHAFNGMMLDICHHAAQLGLRPMDASPSESNGESNEPQAQAQASPSIIQMLRADLDELMKGN